MANYSIRECEAKEYGDCYGYNKNVNVTFMYRDKKGCHIPDEIVEVCLCNTHLCWLNKIHQNKPLEMRGEVAKYSMHDDLFSHFYNARRIYTLVKLESYVNDEEKKYFLINGRNFDKFKTLLRKSMSEKENKSTRIYDQGFFQIFSKIVYEDKTEKNYHFIEDVAEIKDINGELSMEALSKILTTFYKPVESGKLVPISNYANAWIERKEENPTLDTEYTIEQIPDFIRTYFIKKQKQEEYKEFQNCISFIEDEIEQNIIDWKLLSENSSNIDEELFDSFQKLTKALLENNESGNSIIMEMNSSGELTKEVLWITYIIANHELYMSIDPKKKLTKNSKLIDLFIEKGLEKELLTLAISGERLRFLSIKQRDHHDILNENEFVVKYLVPKYIQTSTIIYKTNHNDDHNDDYNNKNVSLTPLEYWHYFSNTTTYIGGGFCNGRDNDETFEKNKEIMEYLEKL